MGIKYEKKFPGWSIIHELKIMGGDDRTIPGFLVQYRNPAIIGLMHPDLPLPVLAHGYYFGGIFTEINLAIL